MNAQSCLLGRYWSKKTPQQLEPLLLVLHDACQPGGIEVLAFRGASDTEPACDWLGRHYAYNPRLCDENGQQQPVSARAMRSRRGGWPCGSSKTNVSSPIAALSLAEQTLDTVPVVRYRRAIGATADQLRKHICARFRVSLEV